jgi:hypothetical protein
MLYTTTELSALKTDSTSSGYVKLIERAENILNTDPLSDFTNGISSPKVQKTT